MKAINTMAFNFFIMVGNTNASKISYYIKEFGDVKVYASGEDSNDFLFNNKSINNMTLDYYKDLFEKIRMHLYIQLSEKCDLKLLNKYLEEALASKKKNTELNRKVKIFFIEAKNSQDFIKIDNVQKTRTLLNKIEKIINHVISIIKDEIEYFDYRVSKDYESIINSISQTKTNKIEIIESNLIFKMSKKESLMLLYILEESGLISFSNEDNKNKFIENNFCFTEVRNNPDKGNHFPMIGISSEISKFKSRVDGESNNKTLEKLLKKLKETIHLFDFKTIKS